MIVKNKADKFIDMLQKEPSLGYIYHLAKESQCMFKATLDGDTEMMEQISMWVHDTEILLLNYNNEADFATAVNLIS